jgi:signal transduction histidine kinase/Tfp pilus assembly protein PilF
MTSAKGFLCLMLITISLSSFAQGVVTDSLVRKLLVSQNETKVDILNQLVYEFISIDNEKVVRYSTEGLQLAKAIGYRKGEAIAHTYRGVYEYQSGQFTAAHISLHNGLRLSRSIGDKNNEGYTLLQLGNCGLEEVNTDSSYLYLKKAYEIFKDSTNPESLSKTYRNLSACFGQKFQQDSQQYYLDKSIVIRRMLPDKTLLVDALAVQASLKLATGDAASVEKLLKEAEQIVKNYPGDLENINDVKHIRALALFQKGKFEEAVVLFDSARNYYFKMSLFRKYITLLTDLGKIFSDRGEYELALNNLYDALRLSQLKNYETETYIIRTRIGWVNFHLGDLQQALSLANESLKTRPKKLLTGDLANALTLKGVVLTDLNKFAEAKKSLDTVQIIFEKAKNVKGLSETFMNLGALEAKLQHYSKALNYYNESLRLAEQVSYSYGLAWSNWGIGDIHFKQGNYSTAAQFLDRSEFFCRKIHANELLIFNFETRRDLLAAQQDYEESLRYSIMAGQLKDSIHRTDVARRFVNLEKIQEIEQRDRNIQVLQQQKEIADDKISLQESRIQKQYILIIAGLVSIGLLATVVFVYYRFYSRIKNLNTTVTEKNTRIEAQAIKLQEVNKELHHLYNAVSEQNEEIQAQANELAETNRSVSDLNRDLEKLIAEKTVELRKTNEELVKHNNELLQFSYTVSHNLRGPVARVLGLSTIVQSETDLTNAKQWIALIARTAAELDTIIKDLSKILELRHEPHRYREAVDLAEEWKQSVSLLQDSLTGTEKITSDFKNVPELVTVRPMLQSIFYNLLSNAIKFKSPDRTLAITATSKLLDDKVVIEIEDNGLGFDVEQHREKIFRLYTRFHSHVEGKGLGLYLVKSQVEVLHGKVDVESKLGFGSRFSVTLPITNEATLHRLIDG